MARRGWVSVTDPAGERWRLAVFDDGWVELPGFGPAPSDRHIVQRTLLLLLGCLGVLVLLSQLAGRLDSGSSEASMVLSAAGLAAVLVSVLLFARLRARARRDGTRRAVLGTVVTGLAVLLAIGLVRWTATTPPPTASTWSGGPARLTTPLALSTTVWVPAIECPSTEITTSPDRIPAFAAGDFLKTCSTRNPRFTRVTVMPTPEKWPESSSLKCSSTLGEK